MEGSAHVEEEPREPVEEDERAETDDEGGDKEGREPLHPADGETVTRETVVRPADKTDAHEAQHDRRRQAAYPDLLVLTRRAHEVGEVDLAEHAEVEREHDDEDEHEAAEREESGKRREVEREVGDPVVEEGGGHEDEQLREQDSREQADNERGKRRQGRLEEEHEGHLASRHAQELIESELLLAPLDQVVVGIDHEKAKDEGEKDRDEQHELPHRLDHLARVRGEEARLVGDRVEGVEHRHAEHERDEVHGVVARGLADVAEGKSKEHRPGLPRWSPRHP